MRIYHVSCMSASGDGSVLNISGDHQGMRVRISGPSGAQECCLTIDHEESSDLFKALFIVRDLSLKNEIKHGLDIPLQDEIDHLGIDRDVVNSLKNRAENAEMALRRLISKVKSGNVSEKFLEEVTVLATKHCSPLR